LQLGGLERTNSFTRFYLALAGVIGWDKVPAIPPELMFLPQWAPVNIYEMSSWTRAIVIPLTILYARKPSWPVPPDARLDELFTSPSSERGHGEGKARNIWKTGFLILDRALKLYERVPWKPGPEHAVRCASQW